MDACGDASIRTSRVIVVIALIVPAGADHAPNIARTGDPTDARQAYFTKRE
jgi:hypothetical protein